MNDGREFNITIRYFSRKAHAWNATYFTKLLEIFFLFNSYGHFKDKLWITEDFNTINATFVNNEWIKQFYSKA